MLYYGKLCDVEVEASDGMNIFCVGESNTASLPPNHQHLIQLETYLQETGIIWIALHTTVDTHVV